MKSKKTKNILFVCKYNAFRSRVAESYFKKINKNKNIKTKSAGIFPSLTKNYLDIIKLLKEQELNLKKKPEGLTEELLHWQDLVVIVAEDIPREVFTKDNPYLKKLLNWKFKDISDKDKNINKKRIKLAKQIMRKVDKLNKNIISGKLKW